MHATLANRRHPADVTHLRPTNGGPHIFSSTSEWRELLLDTGAVLDGDGFLLLLPGDELDGETRIVIAAAADQPTVDTRWEVHTVRRGRRALLGLACLLRRADGTESVQFTSLDLGAPAARRELTRLVGQPKTALLSVCPHSGTLLDQRDIDATAERDEMRRLLAASKSGTAMSPGELTAAHTQLSVKLGGARPLWVQPHAAGPKVGRNSPCPCDSGTKFKRCCGAGNAR